MIWIFKIFHISFFLFQEASDVIIIFIFTKVLMDLNSINFLISPISHTSLHDAIERIIYSALLDNMEKILCFLETQVTRFYPMYLNMNSGAPFM